MGDDNYNKTNDMLLEFYKSESYVEYAYRKNILKESDEVLKDLKNKVLSDKKITNLLFDVSNFNDTIVSTHKNPELPIHKLHFLFDIGLGTDIPKISSALKIIISNMDEMGMYKSTGRVPVFYGGTGEKTMAWALCDAPLMLLAVIRAGYDYEKYVKRGLDYILSLHRSNGFPCAVSKELGKFRGPGKKEDCCPYATLLVLNIFSYLDDYRESDIARQNIDVILSLWEKSRELHPYMFYMGTDFRKIKAPALWYDIVGVTECLSKFSYARNDMRYKEMIEILKGKADENGLFTPQSVYMKCKDWDFGQKDHPSQWLTYLCNKIIHAK